MARTRRGKNRAFFIVWAGQTISVLGSSMTTFAMGIWGFTSTESVTMLSLIIFATSAPGLVLSPLTGALIDRWNRRNVMLSCDLASGMVVLILAVLALTGRLSVWHLVVAAVIGSLAATIHLPAYTASVPLLASKRQLGRVNALVIFSNGVVSAVSPLLAGAMVAGIDIGGVLLVNTATFLVSACSLMLVSIPRPSPLARDADAGDNLLSEAAMGWHYLRARAGLIGLLGVFCFVNVLVAMLSVLYMPLLLGISSPLVLGLTLSAGGVGMALGSAAIMIFGLPDQKVLTLMGGLCLAGLAVAVGGLRPSVTLIGVSLFVVMAVVPTINVSSQVLWQTKVPLDLQGRVFSLRQMIVTCASPAGILLAGPLAERVFEPLLARHGPLAHSVGRVIGVGPGRGIGFLFVLVGLLASLSSIAGYLCPRIRYLETELPDMVDQP